MTLQKLVWIDWRDDRQAALDEWGSASLRQLEMCAQQSYDQLLAASTENWRQWWQKRRITVNGGEAHDQQALDYALYHLRIMTPAHDERSSIAAKGLTGEGYKGIASQPDPEKAPDMIEGLIAMRKMHIRAIEESGLTCADEMLYPENWGYVEDLLSYVAIGARSVEDQQHRLTVSGFDVASGMKNPTSGDFSVMLNSVYAAQHPHHFVYRGYEVETTGNPLTHVVLRGAVSKHGNTTQNYHYEDLIRLHEMYEKMDVIHPAAIIDTNHSNSGKKFKEQIRIAKEVMHNRQLSSDIRSLVKGLMIESYIEEGNQSIGDHIYGKSITDPCLGWEDSKQLIYDIAEMNAK